MQTKIANFTYRFATREDAFLINQFIYELAAYEKLEDECLSTTEKIEKQLFDDKRAEVIIYSYDGVDVGMSLFFTTYSTFEARGCMYLEDLYIIEAYRNRGFGREIFRVLAGVCSERDYARMEWSCLDWNEPSLAFYQNKLGATPQSEWIRLRLNEKEIKHLLI